MTNLAASQTKCNLKHFIVRAKDNSLFLASISRLVFLLSKRFFPFIEYNLAFVNWRQCDQIWQNLAAFYAQFCIWKNGRTHFGKIFMLPGTFLLL